ncbi:MAG: MoaD/ThiS family protein [Gaiellaceae bacterium]
MPEIRIPPILRPDAGGARTVAVDASSVREALAELVVAHPALEARIRQGDGVPAFLNVFVDGEDIRLLRGFDTELTPASKLLLLPAVAGGSQP